MDKSKYPVIVILRADEQRAENELRFTIECKNTNETFDYDLSKKEYSNEFREILGVAAWAIFRLRDSQGHLSRVSILEVLGKFFIFLRAIAVFRPEDLDRAVLSHFAEWLKAESSLSYSTAASLYRKLAPVFLQMSKHPRVGDDFISVKNAFPKSTNLTSSQIGYDQQELKSIVNAAVKGMRESAARLEKKYQPRWLGLPAPLDDVAPVRSNGYRSIWASHIYRVWWWENNCDCKRVNSTFLFQTVRGQCFFNSLSPSGAGSVKCLELFYDSIGAGPGYQPLYVGKPCPILYKTPWKKLDYLVWYWENNLNCQPLSGPEAKKASPEFFGAIKEHFKGSITGFFEYLGVARWIRALDLIPYYLMLLVRTQLNPSTIQRLSIDCLVEDPLDRSRMSINWTKLRSFKKGMTIPVNKAKDNWPVMLIKRVMDVTCPIREEWQDRLWITNSNRHRVASSLGKTSFSRGLREFSQKYGLTTTDGRPLVVQACLLRPTMAWSEYVRTEDMLYLQALLGHSRLSTTSDYLRRLEDPVLRTTIAIHQDAMFFGLTSGVGISKSATYGKETIFNHCKDPLKSPILGQKIGHFCNVNHEVCLGCQNLIITLQDLKKYYCFMNFHDHLLQVGDIDLNEYNKAVLQKRYIWEEYILPKYNKSLLGRIRVEAELSPIPEWDIALYEGGEYEES